MHSAVLAHVRARKTPTAEIGRARSKRGIHIIYSVSGSDRWIAKVARTRETIAQVQREYDALQDLKPWAARFNIPQVIAWHSSPDEVCLIQTMVSGTYKQLAFRLDASEGTLMRLLEAPLQWTRQFTAAAPAAEDTAAVTWRLIAQLAAGSDGIAPAFEALLRDGADKYSVPAVATHGDFFYGNVLYRGDTIAVYDWERFGPGCPLHDCFSYIANSDYYARGRVCTFGERYRHVFFSQSPAAAVVRKAIRDSGFSADAVRHYFYCFIASQLCDKRVTPVEWGAFLQDLEAAGYPGPGARLS